MIDICIIDNGIETLTNRTLQSINNIKNADFYISRISIKDIQKVNKYDFRNEYVLFMYSGDVLDESIDRIVVNFTNTNIDKSNWVCFTDNSIKYYTDTNKSNEIINRIYSFNCLLVSRELLNSVDIEYKGYRYLTYMFELLCKLENKQNGIYINEELVKSNLNRDYLVDDLEYINSIFSDLKNEINNNPIKHRIYEINQLDIDNIKKEKISLCVLSDEVNTSNYDKNIEVIDCNINDTYLNKCIYALNKATGKYIVFSNSKDIINNCDDLYKLVAYASLKGIGAVSPIICNNEKIVYSGVTSLYQKQVVLDLDDLTLEEERRIYTNREVSYNSPSFWVIEKDKLKSINNEKLFDECSSNRTMFQIDRLLEKQGLKNLITGDVVIKSNEKIDNKEYGNLLDLISTYQYSFVYDSKIANDIGYYFQKKLNNNKKVYLPKVVNKNSGKSILVLSHELSLTGAPIVLMQAIELLLKNEYNVFVCAFKDGPLHKDLLKLNIPVMIISNESEEYNWDTIIYDFDYVLINTIVPFKEVNRFTKYSKKVIWWLHDARLGYDEYLKEVIPNSINNNVDIYAVSEYAKQACTRYRRNYKIDILPYGIEDRANNEYTNPYNTDKKVYLCVGTIEKRKGQDVLLQAIDKLPDSIRNNCLFVFVGRRISDENNPIYDQLCDFKSKYSENIQYIESIPHDELFSYIKYANAVVCPSKDDPLPTIMSEAMMFNNICICSSNTGTASFIINRISGYIYENDDSNKLLECLIDSYNENNSDEIKHEARIVFENNFMLNILEGRLLEIFK